MSTTGPLEILVTIVLLLVVVACVAICIVAVRWLRRIALQVEEEQARRREREDAAAQREADAAARQAEAAERERARAAAEDDRLKAERQSDEDLQQIRRRVALADEEAAQAKAEAARAEAEAAQAKAEAARALLELTQIRIETEKARFERGQTDEAQADRTPVGRDEENKSGVSTHDGEDPGGVGDLVPGEIADLLRHLGLPAGWGEGVRPEDVSVQGIDPRLLRRIQGLIPPEVMRRLSSGRGPADIESIGDWIRSQIERSTRDGRDGPNRGRRPDRPAGFQRTEPVDEDPAVSGNEPEAMDVSDGRPDAATNDQRDAREEDLPDELVDDLSGPVTDPATAAAGGLDVAALIEEALRDRDRRRSGGANQKDSAEPDSRAGANAESRTASDSAGEPEGNTGSSGDPGPDSPEADSSSGPDDTDQSSESDES